MTTIAYLGPQKTNTHFAALKRFGKQGHYLHVPTVDHVFSFVERRFVRVTGRKDSPGRPFFYGTTIEFLRHFGLKSLDALPPMAQPSINEPTTEEPQPATLGPATIGLAEPSVLTEATLATSYAHGSS